MIAIIMASMLVAAGDPVPTQVGDLKKEPVRYCRALIIGASRSGDVKICRTKKQWADVDACSGPTRYCSPAQKAAMAKKHSVAFALNEDSRVVCRIVAGTGSRLSSARLCLPVREWQRMWDESRATMGKLQNTFSTMAPGEGEGRGR